MVDTQTAVSNGDDVQDRVSELVPEAEPLTLAPNYSIATWFSRGLFSLGLAGACS